ncbi:class I SAM-dependent methyltransferase [Candidatus Odyssella acanthamoebae]|uniref:Methyltransferase domain-containing protein n=1 Tax=Candidatus Odyssella acanthamoebae TaxID=91604 RepID=A0A077AUL5_9PROT|nr:class I SAM-dependent methyltransferase [Candidatus Paracaedibacter acanthamoebae]AIK95724.1 hypothetical protein ID47_01690 [Candidatus Paracaedibacter acanthamoebae]
MAQINLLNTFCEHHLSPVYEKIKNETWGKDSINLASLLSMQELIKFNDWFNLTSEMSILDACCGVGESTMYFARKTNCKAYGVDISIHAINSANDSTKKSCLNVEFLEGDLKNSLPFSSSYFDAVVCIEAIVYFNYNERLSILKEWNRILKLNAKLIYTDPCIISGIITNNEIMQRASFGEYFFTPLKLQEDLFKSSGFELIKSEDITTNNAEILSNKWWDAREKNKPDLQKLEGIETFNHIQSFIDMCRQLYNKNNNRRKLSQFAYYLVKREELL